MRLFFIPYAGANRFAFKDLEKEFPPWFIIHPLELPGRGNRFTEHLISNIDEAVEDMAAQIAPFTGSSYAIFGHSLGAVLGYLVTSRFEENNVNVPQHLFCSGRSTLWNSTANNWTGLHSQEFWNKILDLGGLPASSFENQEVRMLFEPILRADFYMVDRIELNPPVSNTRIRVKTTVILGNEDKLTLQPSSWVDHTVHPPKVVYFPGGHFYFHRNAPELAQLIGQTLSAAVENYT